MASREARRTGKRFASLRSRRSNYAHSRRKINRIRGPTAASVPLILGRSLEGALITLYGCIQLRISRGLEGIRKTSLSVNGVLFGAHFEKVDTMLFGTVSATFPQLKDWIGSSGFSIQHPNRDTFVITEQSSFLATTALSDFKLSIGFSFSEHGGEGEFGIQYVPYVSIEFNKQIHLKRILELLYHLSNFFALASHHPIYAESIKVFTEAKKVVLPPDGKSFQLPIELVYENVNWGVPHDQVSITEMLFEFSKIRSRFDNIMQNWFDKAELLEPINGMYSGTLYNSHMYLQQKFLSLVQCVESYDRRVLRRIDVSKEEAEKRVADILDATPTKYKDWLKNKLRYSNEPTLRKRLEQLVQTFSFVDFENVGQFIEDVVNTRNYLTHYDEVQKQSSATPERMSWLALKLGMLTEAILLAELGLSLDEVKLITQRTKQRLAGWRILTF